MPLESVYLNGGFIGSTVGYQKGKLPEYVGGRIQGYDGTTGNITFSLTSLTGGLASAPAEGDLVVVCFASSSFDNLPYRISGYTQLADLFASDSRDTNLQVGYKIMTSSPDTSVTITGGTALAPGYGDFYAGAIAVQVWRNVDTSAPFDVASTTATTPNTVLANPPSITPITPGAIILAVGAGAHINGTRTFTSSDLTNFLTVGRNDTYDITIGLGSYSWTSGAFDPAQFGFTASDSTTFSSCAVTMALRPKPASGSGMFNLQAVLEGTS